MCDFFIESKMWDFFSALGFGVWDFFCNFAFAFFEEAIAIYRGYRNYRSYRDYRNLGAIKIIEIIELIEGYNGYMLNIKIVGWNE